MKKFFTLASLLALTSVAAMAETEYLESAGQGAKDSESTFTSFTVAGTYNPGPGASILSLGDYSSKAAKWRSNKNGNTLELTVNAGYTITAIDAIGTSNYAGTDVVITGVYVDGAESSILAQADTLKHADNATPSAFSLTGFEATQKIVFAFNNVANGIEGANTGNQINLLAKVTYQQAPQTVYHALGEKYPRAPFEYVNMSNTLTNSALKDGAKKYGINDQYPWIVYNYSASILDNGNSEVSRGGIYVSKNPVTFMDEVVYMVDDSSKWLGSPKVEVGYTKNADNTWNLCPKTLTINVEKMTKVEMLLTGGGSNTNVADIFVYDAADNSLVKTIKSDTLVGKSNKANGSASTSKVVTIADLDSTKSYSIIIAPAASALQIEKKTVDEDKDTVKVYFPYDLTENLLADVNNVEMTNIKSPSIYVAALRLFSADRTLADMKTPKAQVDEYYSPVGKKVPGAAYSYINLSNTIRMDATLTTFDAEGNATVANKYCVKDDYPWVYYNYTGSVLDNQMMEVARGGYYYSYNPYTGNKEVTYLTDDNDPCLWIGSPKMEVGYVKGSYFNKFMPKTMSFNVKEATKVDILLTGAGSNTNQAVMKVIKKSDNSVVKVITSALMPGKSNKANGSASNSQFITVDSLDFAESYTIIIAPDTAVTTLEVSIVDGDGDITKVTKPYSDILKQDFLSGDIDAADSLKISNIKSPTIAVGAIRVYSNDTTVDNTLNGAIATAKAAGENTVNLNNNFTYYLNGVADADGMTINGKGATVVADTLGQMTLKKSLTIDNIKLDASASKVAPIAMAATLNAADSLAQYYKVPSTRIDSIWKDSITANILSIDTTWTISKVDTTWKDETKAEISKIDTTYSISKIDTTFEKVKVLAEVDTVPIMVVRYEGAGQDCFYADKVELLNSEVSGLKAPLFTANNGVMWALTDLTINNSIVEVATNLVLGNGGAFLDFYDKGKMILNIDIENSTLYSDSAKTDSYFIRLNNASNARPDKVWGSNSAKATCKFISNTFVNMNSNKNMADRYLSNAGWDTLTWKNNVFANTYRLQKMGGNNALNFTAADNAICGGTNPVDGSDKTKYATEDNIMAAHFDVTVPDFHVIATSYAAKMGYGDPRWAVKYVDINEVKVAPAAGDSIVKDSLQLIQITFANADSIKATDTASVVIKMADSIVYTVNEVAAKVAGNSIIAAISAEEAAKLAAGDYTISVKANSFELYYSGLKVAVSEEVNSNFVLTEPVVDSIEEVETVAADGKMYNLAGQRVNNAKGLVIMNGRKMMIK